ncbi:putative pterin-binding protein [Paraburkholderia saeva]|uniref:Oxidoreductase molybdopterin-binding domain-containing protein n=1 Tax=Paraburkholderia saeva TaxID=2777537 RepID=A0A9N8RVU8_9BURK|nr:molybdopterin-dependent oxidoreductase [Paraburkholderia saeva]CAG4888440.1 hypothetical protein R52603_00663 [Paraburkholderia saeva]CAG4893321.1 hypothetical protein R70241_01547 [Paraburkholderia saeva]CAG4895699.1 hypothetical protein LMG31841_02207 [Paraburkholderia saeva]
MRYPKALLWAFLVLAAVARSACAAPLTLDVRGAITQTNDAAHSVFHFPEAELLALPAHSITTSTAWTPKSTFTGPSLSDVLAKVGARGTMLEIHTLDDYTCTVPVTDAAKYGVILAHSMNGKRLKVSDFGPLFLIYPRDAFPAELQGAVGDAKFAWQIKSIVVK